MTKKAQEMIKRSEEMPFLIAALYHFVSLNKIDDWQTKIKNYCDEQSLFGTILIAPEGINGTVAGSHKGINNFVYWLCNQPQFKELEIKYSQNESCPFHRMKVRLKKEIVTMGKPDINPSKSRGVYVKPQDWNN